MPGQAVAAARGPAGQQGGDQQQQQQGGLNQLVSTLLRFAIMYWLMNQFRSTQPQAPTPAGATAPLFRKGDPMDVYVYISESPLLGGGDAQLVWTERDVGLATAAERKLTHTYAPSEAVQNNGSLFAHVVFARAGVDPDTPQDERPPDSVFSKTHELIAFMPRPLNKTGTNLLSEGGNFTSQRPPKANETQREWISFFRPNLTIAMVDHFVTYPKGSVPPQIAPHLLLSEEGQQYPLVYFDDFWLLRDKMVPMNGTVQDLPLHLSLTSQTLWRMQLQQQMEQSFALQISTGLAQEGEQDEVKRIFIEGNPYLLALTMAVSLLHTVFDFLAFKNDIGFWRENKSMEGLSARSVVVNAFCQLIIFLYLLDNETSMVVLFSSGVGVLIEFWKVTKAMDVSLTPTFPYLSVKDRASYTDNPTHEYDRTAMRYLSYVLYPLVIGSSVYSLVYKEHTSWYSWLLGSLVSAVYMFGFILMCPQLYLNYKLKSVAHLPWRQMTYKFLNTIIDDLFAFVIKMPTLHRLSVFRDDVIFLIYLYQRWIYRVDMTRVNEFGFSGQQAAEAEAAKAQGGAGAGAAAANGGAAEGEEEAEVLLEDSSSGGDARARRRRGGTAAAASEAAASNGEAEAADGEGSKEK